MVSRALDEIDPELRKRVYIIPLEDIYRNALWVSHVCSMVPPFQVVFSNNPLVIRLFKEAGFEVRKTKLYNRRFLQGREIRRLMIEGGNWEKYVPKAVADVIREIGGVERLREIAKNDRIAER